MSSKSAAQLLTNAVSRSSSDLTWIRPGFRVGSDKSRDLPDGPARTGEAEAHLNGLQLDISKTQVMNLANSRETMPQPNLVSDLPPRWVIL